MANHNRGYYREMRKKHIRRRKRIDQMYGDYWQYKYEGELSKGKIHCSCGMCMAKTRNKKYRRRHIHGNYAPNINYKFSEKKKILNMEEQLKELDQDYSLYLEEENEPSWEIANVEGITVDGIPLDGHYIDRLVSSF
jgi:hypothetical protein